MSEPVNPYAPPVDERNSQSSIRIPWSKRRRTRVPTKLGSYWRFRMGLPLMMAGFQIRIDPFVPAIVYAATPSSRLDTRRCVFVLHQAVDAVDSLSIERPAIAKLIAGRHIIVEIIADYSNAREVRWACGVAFNRDSLRDGIDRSNA